MGGYRGGGGGENFLLALGEGLNGDVANSTLGEILETKIKRKCFQIFSSFSLCSYFYSSAFVPPFLLEMNQAPKSYSIATILPDSCAIQVSTEPRRVATRG